MDELIKIFLGIVIGNIIGYQYAKYKFYGEVDVLFWKVKNRVKII